MRNDEEETLFELK